MPFTQAYSDHLNNLSTSIEHSLDQLYEKSLSALVGEPLTSKDTNLKKLLETPVSNLKKDIQEKIRGNNESELGARQRWFLLRQAWNDISAIQLEIKNGQLTTTEDISRRIQLTEELINGEYKKFSLDIFKPHQLSDRKVNFIKSVLGVANRLLLKQLAVQNILATNTKPNIPDQPNFDPTQTTGGYNELNTASTQALQAIQNQINEMEKIKCELKMHQLNVNTPDDNITNKHHAVITKSTELVTALNHEKDESQSIESINANIAKLETATKALQAAISDYETAVDRRLMDDSSKTIRLTEEKSAALLKLIESIDQALQKNENQEVAEASTLKAPTLLEKYKNHLTRLTTLLANENQCINDAAVARESAVDLLSISEHDRNTLTTLKSWCEKQSDYYLQRRAKEKLKIEKWGHVYNSAETSFKTLAKLHTDYQGLSGANKNESYFESSHIRTLENAIATTTAAIARLELLPKAAENTHPPQTIPMESNPTLSQLALKKTDLCEKCGALMENLAPNKIAEKYNSHYETITATKILLEQSSEKIAPLIAQRDHLLSQQSLKKYLESILTEQSQRYESNPFKITSNDHSPTALQNELNSILINLSAFPMSGTESIISNPLTELRKKIYQLEDAIDLKNRRYPSRDKGMLFGALAGGALATALCGGIVASVILSFGLALPIIIAAGVAAAIAPGLFGGVGRFFGLRKDNKAFKNSCEIKAELRVDNNQKSHPRENRVKRKETNQPFTVSVNNPHFDSQMKAAIVPIDKQRVTERMKTHRFLSIWGSEVFKKHSLHQESMEDRIEETDSDIAPSYPAPTEILTSPERPDKDRPDNAPRANPEPQANSGYSLLKGGQFKHFTLSFTQRAAPQQVQREASESVVVNAHGPG